jgi:adenylate cyclase
VGSRGYDRSGVGSEIRLGDGIIGVAARQCTPIRILHTAPEYLYGRAARESFKAGGMLEVLETEIPLPGLVESRSQLAVPILQEDRLLGVLYVESPDNLRFSYEDEDALVMLSQQLSMAIRLSQLVGESRESERLAPEQTPLTGAPLVIRRYPANNSIFIDGSYLIKGVAGAIFCPLSGILIALGIGTLLSLDDLQFAMLVVFGALPPAVLNYMLAERFNQQPEQVASIVMMGNLASMVVIPTVLVFVL